MPAPREVVDLSDDESDEELSFPPPSGTGNLRDFIANMDAYVANHPTVTPTRPAPVATTMTPTMRLLDLENPATGRGQLATAPIEITSSPERTPSPFPLPHTRPVLAAGPATIKTEPRGPPPAPAAPNPAPRSFNPTAHFFDPMNEFPMTKGAQRTQAAGFVDQTHGSPVGQYHDGASWRTAFQVYFRRAGVRFRVPIDTTRPHGQMQISRRKVILGRGIFGEEMIVWLRDRQGILGRNWTLGAQDQDKITKGMLLMWNEEYASRGTSAGTPLWIEDDTDAEKSEDEEVETKPVIKKENKGERKKKGGSGRGYHGSRRDGDEGDGDDGGSSGNCGPGSVAQPIEV